MAVSFMGETKGSVAMADKLRTKDGQMSLCHSRWSAKSYLATGTGALGIFGGRCSAGDQRNGIVCM